MSRQIPAAIAEAMAAVGRPYIPELTGASLVSALTPRRAAGQPEPLPEGLTKREVCDAIRLSLPTVNRMLRRGELPYRKIGHSVRIPRTALCELLSVSDGEWQRPQCG